MDPKPGPQNGSTGPIFLEKKTVFAAKVAVFRKGGMRGSGLVALVFKTDVLQDADRFPFTVNRSSPPMHHNSGRRHRRWIAVVLCLDEKWCVVSQAIILIDEHTTTGCKTFSYVTCPHPCGELDLVLP